MSTDNILHSRLYKIAGVCYADEVIISQAEFDDLEDHYYEVLDRLAKPWQDRDVGYDVTGRFNTGGMDEYKERI